MLLNSSMDFSELKKTEAIFCDCDGTLLNPESRLSLRTIKAVKHIKDRIPFFLCSGRNYPALIPIYDTLGLQTPMITINGAVIATKDGILSETDLPVRVVSEVLTLLEPYNSNLSVSLYVQKSWWVNNLSNPYLKKEMEVCDAVPNQLFSNGKEVKDLPVSKLLLIGDEALISQLKNQLSFFQEKVQLIRIYPNYLEVCTPLADKGTGVKAVAEHFHFHLEHILVCGDTMADEPMFSLAGYKACPKNAAERIKAISDIQLPSNGEDGIAVLLEKLSLLFSD